MSLDEIDWTKLYSSCGNGIRVYETLMNLKTADNEEFMDLMEALGDAICDQCAYNSTIAAVPFIVDIFSKKTNREQLEKLLEILTVCIAWETDEILEDCTEEIKVSYFESLERIKPLVRDFIHKNSQFWNKESRYFIFASYITILGDKCYGKYLISCPDEAEVYCTECGYEGIMNFDGQREYDIDKVDCFSKEDYEYMIEFLSQVDIVWKKTPFFGFFEDYECPECGKKKKGIYFAEDFYKYC